MSKDESYEEEEVYKTAITRLMGMWVKIDHKVSIVSLNCFSEEL